MFELPCGDHCTPTIFNAVRVSRGTRKKFAPGHHEEIGDGDPFRLRCSVAFQYSRPRMCWRAADDAKRSRLNVVQAFPTFVCVRDAVWADLVPLVQDAAAEPTLFSLNGLV
jgi:hypothetical protein